MTEHSNNKPAVTRNRKATRKKLIKAVGSILSKNGFTGIGINAVAKEAGVDKVLIYRYFGGLPQLISAFGCEGNFWPSIEELAGGDIEKFGQLSVEEKLLQLGINYMKALKKRPITQEIMAWEMVERNELTIELETIRETSILRFFEMFFPLSGDDVDLPAVVAIIGAGISYLVTRSRNIQMYTGIDLQSESGVKRLEDAIGLIVKGITTSGLAQISVDSENNFTF